MSTVLAALLTACVTTFSSVHAEAQVGELGERNQIEATLSLIEVPSECVLRHDTWSGQVRLELPRNTSPAERQAIVAQLRSHALIGRSETTDDRTILIEVNRLRTRPELVSTRGRHLLVLQDDLPPESARAHFFGHLCARSAGIVIGAELIESIALLCERPEALDDEWQSAHYREASAEAYDLLRLLRVSSHTPLTDDDRDQLIYTTTRGSSGLARTLAAESLAMDAALDDRLVDSLEWLERAAQTRSGDARLQFGREWRDAGEALYARLLRAALQSDAPQSALAYWSRFEDWHSEQVTAATLVELATLYRLQGDTQLAVNIYYQVLDTELSQSDRTQHSLSLVETLIEAEDYVRAYTILSWLEEQGHKPVRVATLNSALNRLLEDDCRGAGCDAPSAIESARSQDLIYREFSAGLPFGDFLP